MARNKRNFYQILKVPPDASASDIKRAYRAAAKRYHPDVSNKYAEKFKEIQEAYETLSDPDKKKRYDGQGLALRPEKIRVREPLFHEDIHLDLFDHLDPFTNLDLETSWSDFVDDFFFGRDSRQKKQYVEIVLTPEEAKEGGEIELDIPVQVPCSRCRGTGRSGRLICSRCRGRGEEKLQKRITLHIPPDIRDGSEARIPIYTPTIHDLQLIATIRVNRY